MLFNSWTFIGLLLLTATAYHLPPFRRWQAWVLLLSGFVFYAYDSPGLLLLLIFSALLNAAAGYGARYLRHSRLCATLGVGLNLLLLALFKYGGLISNSFLNTSDGVGHFLCMLPLPLGISFYTFSGISLVVDAYRGRTQTTEPKPPFLQYVRQTVLYVTFFPKLLAGPIVKSKDFVAQIGYKSLADVDWTKVFKALEPGSALLLLFLSEQAFSPGPVVFPSALVSLKERLAGVYGAHHILSAGVDVQPLQSHPEAVGLVYDAL